jgi:hypothetical protein
MPVAVVTAVAVVAVEVGPLSDPFFAAISGVNSGVNLSSDSPLASDERCILCDDDDDNDNDMKNEKKKNEKKKKEI